MTYTDDEKRKLFALRDAGCTWEQIGIALGKSTSAVKQWYHEN